MCTQQTLTFSGKCRIMHTVASCAALVSGEEQAFTHGFKSIKPVREWVLSEIRVTN